jgi:hypothetical protein
MKKCIFCGAVGKLSEEHIIPKWLLKELDLSAKDMARGSHLTLSGIAKSERTHSVMTHTNAAICQDCNNGWMSRLENSAKDLIIGLMNMDTEAFGSLPGNSEILAKWTFKTAIVRNYPSNYRNVVSEDHFQYLYRSEIPRGVYINLAFTSNTEKIIQSIQSQTVLIIGLPENYFSRLREVYKITLKFKHLLLRISYIPFEDFTQGADSSIALWPRFGRYEDLKLYKDILEFDASNYFIRI